MLQLFDVLIHSRYSTRAFLGSDIRKEWTFWLHRVEQIPQVTSGWLDRGWLDLAGSVMVGSVIGLVWFGWIRKAMHTKDT